MKELLLNVWEDGTALGIAVGLLLAFILYRVMVRMASVKYKDKHRSPKRRNSNRTFRKKGGKQSIGNQKG